MNENDIEDVFQARVADNPAGLPGSNAWPNQDHGGAVPYLEFLFTGGTRTGGRLAGGSRQRSLGVLVVNVCTARNTGTEQANDFAAALAALFPEGQRFNFSGGQVTILQPPDIRKGFPRETEWVVPVAINFVAIES